MNGPSQLKNPAPATRTALQEAARYLRAQARQKRDIGLCFTVEHGTHVRQVEEQQAVGYDEAALLIQALIP